MPKCRYLFLLLIGLFCCLLSPACADYYRYRDDSGSLNFTDDPKSVPKRYKNRLERIKESPPPVPDKPPLPEPQTEVQNQVQEPQPASIENYSMDESWSIAKLLLMIRTLWELLWVQIIVLIVGMGLGFWLLTRLLRPLGSATITRFIYLAFFFGVGVLCFKLYADSLGTELKMLKSRSEAVLEQSKRRTTATADVE